jgi:hypothetical protein
MSNTAPRVSKRVHYDQFEKPLPMLSLHHSATWSRTQYQNHNSICECFHWHFIYPCLASIDFRKETTGSKHDRPILAILRKVLLQPPTLRKHE